jgi:glucarate dehydratase
MKCTRRGWLAAGIGGAGISAAGLGSALPLDKLCGQEPVTARQATERRSRDLTIKELRVTPIALPDPPLLAASGCHGPYFLRAVVELVTTDGVVGLGETHGGEEIVADLLKAARLVAGKSATAFRQFAPALLDLGSRVYAGIELACLDAIGRATGLRVCDLLGGPIVPEPEFAAYLFFRYAADHPKLLADGRIVDARGRGAKALDPWGEVRTPEAMADLAWKFHEQFGFRVHKLKAGVLEPEVELEALQAISERFGGKHQVRIDPNGRWKVETAIEIGRELRDLPLEYYEDPVRGQEAMAEVRRRTDLPMSTNMCVVEFDDIPPALRTRPVDVVLADHHYWGGVLACQALGTLAPTLDWKLSQHSNNHAGITMAAMIHLAACLPNLSLASDTHYPWLPDGSDILPGGKKLRIAQGRMQIPPGPGLGIELDRDRLAQAHETYQKCKMRDRDDAATMRLIDPLWQRELF